MNRYFLLLWCLVSPLWAAGLNWDVTLFVDQASPDAIDTGVDAGTGETPFKTVSAAAQRAMAVAAEGKSVGVFVRPGTYRESIEMVGQSETDYAPITIQGVSDEVTITGAEPWNGWKIERNGAFEHAWPYGESVAPMIFVQGVRVIHMPNKKNLGPGESTLINNGKTVLMLPPKNGVVREGNVEVAERTELLRVQNLDSVTVSGLKLHGTTNGAEPASLGAVSFQQTASVQLEELSVQYNEIGLSVFHSKALTLNGVTASRNSVSGAKLYWNNTVEINGGEYSLNGVHSDGSESYGLGLRKTASVAIRRAQITENRLGLLLSYISDGAEVDAAHVFVNREVGVEAVSTKGLYMSGCIIASTGDTAMEFRGSAGEVKNTIFYSAEGKDPLLIFESMNQVSLTDNIAANFGSGMLVVASGVTETDEWGSNLFFAKKEKCFSYSDKSHDFSGWQDVTGNDLNSFFGDPLFVDPGRYEFALRNASPWFKKNSWPVR
ncbi:right-handed parallel beta-helix repeat-containing protein [Rubellicoccus peritrichatus]|uniref:Right-handed parallel beta-helix repeat-containing protein n=1 Tax=Rubellicoccus peritrichatus TaxID=3080537 RepID=A0AAQ3LAT8_9BACT|nr:right-handed parallel beta-helix repeat-containing protein [Puniceicoccus sp. CR14]WOO42425.1 right-handed parallel beta-helix repeat-containing protein [Puniceicoccus sp. CR14]